MAITPVEWGIVGTVAATTALVKRHRSAAQRREEEAVRPYRQITSQVTDELARQQRSYVSSVEREAALARFKRTHAKYYA